MRKFFKGDNIQSLANIISQGTLSGINFLLIIIFTHYLSVNDYGIVSIYLSYTLFLNVIIGLNTQGSIGVAKVYFDESKYYGYLASILLLSYISFIFFVLFVFVFNEYIADFTELSNSLLYLLVLHSFGMFCYSFITTKYIFERKAQYSCILTLLISFSMLILSYIGIKYDFFIEEQYIIRILSLAIPYIVCIFIVFFKIIYNNNPLNNFKENIIFCLPICIPLIFHGFSHIVLSQTDKIMLQKILENNGVVGIYSFTSTFTHVLNTISVALNNTWVPIFYNFLKEKNLSMLTRRTKLYANFYTMMVLGFLMLVPEIIFLLAQEDYYEGILMIPIMVLPIFLSFIYLFAVNFELYHKETKLVATGTFLAALINILLNHILIPYYGMYGAAYATFIAYIFLVIFHMYFAKKINSTLFPYNFKFFYKYFILVLGGCLLYYLFLDFWLIRWVIAACIGMFVFKQVYQEKNLF